MARLNMGNEDINTSGSGSTLTHAERMLAAIEAALEGRITDDYKSLKINNREITKHSFDELRRLREYYRAEVARIKAYKRKTFKNIGYRF